MSNTPLSVNKNLKLKFNPKIVLVVLIFLALIVIEVLYDRSYFDEILGLVAPVYLLFSRKKIKREDLITILVLSSVILIGVISNIISNLTQSVFSICVDIIASTKLITTFFALKYFLSDEEKKQTINLLTPIAKLFCLLTFICSIISLFTDIGMSYGEVRYGITPFVFVFTLAHQYVAVYMLIFGIIVCNTKMSKNKKQRYYIIAIISLLMATKSPAIMFSFIFLFLLLYFRKHQHIQFWVVVLFAITLVITGKYQINEYILNTEAPRRLFFEYGFKTANNYFPLGSGFSTFGSDQAARNYSQLYYQYGFDKTWGMTPDYGPFLSDTFWAMAIGQFGYFGAAIYLYVYIRIFLSFSNINIANNRRAFLYAAFLQYMIQGVGSAILSSSAGMIGFAAIALFTNVADITDEKKKLPRIKIRL